MTRRIACVIPAYQAAATIGEVVSALRRALPSAAVHVIDDGSTDDTAMHAAEAGASVVRFVENRGKGAALREGFLIALASGCDAVVTLDADAQHDPAYARALLAALDGADVVIGQRARQGTRMPLHRRLSNSLSSAAISFCAGCRIVDAQSGYRAIDSRVLRAVRPVGDRYEFETDMLILAGRRGFRIVGVDVPTIYGPVSHFRSIGDTRRVAGRIWRRIPTVLA